MDTETKEFLTTLFETLKRQMSEDLIATGQRIITRTDELITAAKIEMINGQNQWKRTRDLRIFALESRLGEIEKRVDQIESGSGSS